MLAPRPCFSEVWNEHESSERHSAKAANYLYVYDKFLDRFIGRSPTLIEFGVRQGGSLEIWRKLFGPSARIIGVESNPDWVEYCKDMPAEIILGRQQDKAVLEKLPDPDIVIDDAGHIYEDQRETFQALWPRLRDGGIYAIEDVCQYNCKIILDMVNDVPGPFSNYTGLNGYPLHVYPEILIAEKISMPRWRLIERGVRLKEYRRQ